MSAATPYCVSKTCDGLILSVRMKLVAERTAGMCSQLQLDTAVNSHGGLNNDEMGAK